MTTKHISTLLPVVLFTVALPVYFFNRMPFLKSYSEHQKSSSFESSCLSTSIRPTNAQEFIVSLTLLTTSGVFDELVQYTIGDAVFFSPLEYPAVDLQLASAPRSDACTTLPITVIRLPNEFSQITPDLFRDTIAQYLK